MASYNLAPIGNGFQFLTTGGLPLNAGQLFTYAAGTSTPQATYTTSAGSVPNANPIILGVDGRTPNEIWLTSGVSYKFVLEDSLGNIISTYDNLTGINDVVTAATEWVASGYSPTYISPTSFSVAGDRTSIFQQYRRVRATVGSNYVYGSVVSAVFSGVTTVTLVMDSTNLDNSLTAVDVSFLSAINPSIPVVNVPNLDNSTKIATTAFVDKTGPVIGSMRNGKMSVTAASATATFTADEIIVETALGGAPLRLASYSQAVNLATTGAGGMDTGTAPISGYVALYAIYNPSTATTSILATNATPGAVGNIYGGANMPSGYTASALISVWPTNGSSQLVVGYQCDRHISYVSLVVLNTTTPVTSPTSLSISSAIPANARSVDLVITAAETTSGSGIYLYAESTSSMIGQATVSASASGATSSSSVSATLDIATAQTIYYHMATANAGTFSISVSGYSV